MEQLVAGLAIFAFAVWLAVLILIYKNDDDDDFPGTGTT